MANPQSSGLSELKEVADVSADGLTESATGVAYRGRNQKYIGL